MFVDLPITLPLAGLTAFCTGSSLIGLGLAGFEHDDRFSPASLCAYSLTSTGAALSVLASIPMLCTIAQGARKCSTILYALSLLCYIGAFVASLVVFCRANQGPMALMYVAWMSNLFVATIETVLVFFSVKMLLRR